MSNQECEEQIDRDATETRSSSARDQHHGGGEKLERLVDRLKRMKSFEASRADWIRQQELEKPRPDYGTFLKDEELVELFPEAADFYHVDDIRRGLMMIRRILDYGENAFTAGDGVAAYDLLSCILEQEDYWFDGTWSANNPSATERDVPARPTPMPGLDFDDEDDDENE
jgi:hypothetical protein